MRPWFSWILLLLSAFASAATAVQANELDETVLEVFVRDDSESCRQAVDVARTFSGERQGLNLVVRNVLTDEEALRRYWQLVRKARIAQPVMPGVSCGAR